MVDRDCTFNVFFKEVPQSFPNFHGRYGERLDLLPVRHV